MKNKRKTVEGWITKRLDEIGTIFSGSTPSTSVRSFWNGEIVWATPNDLSKLNTPYLSDSDKRITVKGLDGCSAHLLPAGSIVMSSRAPIGYVAIPTVEFCTNQGCKSIQLKDNFTTEFTYYNLLFNIDKVKNLGEGTTFAEISKTALSTVELAFPSSKPEQTKIAEILSTVDRAIEQTGALIAKQQRIKTGLMQDLLTRGIDEHGNLRSEQTHQFKDSPLGRIPVEWAVKTLSDFYAEPARNGLYKPKEFYGAGNSMIHMPQMFRGLTVDVASAVRVQVDRSEMDRFGLQTNDLLIARRSLVLEGAGRCALVPEVTEPTTFESSIIRVRLRQSQLNATFVNFFLNSDAGYRMRLPFIRQVAVSGVSGEDVGQFYIPVPDADEQSRIIDCFCKSEVLICGMFATTNKIKRQKTALMQDLLTGKKRVTDLLNDTEVAGV